MKLRTQSIWLVASTSFCYVIVVSLVAGWILLPTADREDKAAMTLQLQRLRGRLDEQVNLMQVVAQDYAARAETLSFVQRAHISLPSENDSVPEQLRRVAVDVVIVWDASGRLRLARGTTTASHSMQELSSGVVETVAAMVPRTRVKDELPQKGVLATPEGLLLFGAASIKGERHGPPSQGVLVCGRFLSPQAMQAAATGETHIAELWNYAEPVPAFELIDRKRMRGSFVLEDPASRPVATIIATAPRSVRQVEKRSLLIVFGALATSSLIFGLLAWRLLIRRFIERIERLTATVASVEAIPGVWRQLTEQTGQDEIAQLARATGTMAGSLAQAREKAEAATKAKGEFLAAMSHEIRTPLTAVLGYLGLLQESKLTPKQAEQVRVIEESGEVLLEVINEILDFSKLETRKVVIESLPTDVPGIAGEVMKLFSPRLEYKGVEGTLLVDDNTPPRLLADPLRVRQVLNNLVSNAVKFTQSGSVQVRVESLSDMEGVRVRVQDTGIGMTPEQLAKLFQPFAQADGSITRRYGGTGLGLAISQRLVESWGGKLTVKTDAGKGSTFTFTLPAPIAPLPVGISESGTGEASAAPSRTPFDLDSAKFPLNILVAEDNRVNAHLLGQILSRCSYTAKYVVNGRAALDAMAEADYDLVLMDIHMPEMGGVEATKLRRLFEQEHQCRPVFIAAITANALSGAREECLEAGMNEFLTKPFQLTQVRSVLERAIARKQN